MIEETLAQQYGVFGLWTISNLMIIWYLFKAHREDKKQIINVVSENSKTHSILAEKINNLGLVRQ